MLMKTKERKNERKKRKNEIFSKLEYEQGFSVWWESMSLSTFLHYVHDWFDLIGFRLFCVLLNDFGHLHKACTQLKYN